MTILEIIDSATNGGAEKHARLIAKQFTRLGHKVLFVYPPGPYTPEYRTLEEYGVKCIELDIRYRNTIGILLFLRRLIQSERVNLIHSHLFKADFLVSLVQFLTRSPVPHFLTIHTLFKDTLPFNHFLKSAFVYVTLRFAYSHSSQIFCLADSAAQDTLKRFNLRPTQISVIRNSVDPDELIASVSEIDRIRARYNLSPDKTYLLCAGVLHRRKGQDILIRSMHDGVPESHIHLLLLGEGPAQEYYERLISELNLESRVHLIAFQRNINPWFKIASIYLQPSLQDTMPNAIIEAMTFGLPTITSNLSTFLQIIRPGVNALTVPAGSTKDLSSAIRYVLDNPQDACRIGKAGQSFVLKNCTMDLLAKAILSHLESGPFL